MAKVDKMRTLRKALLRGAQYAAVAAAAIQTVPVPDTVGIDQKATVVFIIGLIGAIGKGVHNYKKTSGRAPFLGSRSGLALLLAGLSVATPGGCVATHGADGGWTVRVDQPALDAAWDRYEAMERRQTDLERERETATGPRLEAIRKELEVIGPQVRELADVLGVDLAGNAKKMPR